MTRTRPASGEPPSYEFTEHGQVGRPVLTLWFVPRELISFPILAVLGQITPETMSTPKRAEFTEPIDDDLSAGWRAVFVALDCPTSIEPPAAARAEQIAAATREDRPARYRRKHRMGVSS